VHDHAFGDLDGQASRIEALGGQRIDPFAWAVHHASRFAVVPGDPPPARYPDRTSANRTVAFPRVKP
jgi:hypothetical protein